MGRVPEYMQIDSLKKKQEERIPFKMQDFIKISDMQECVTIWHRQVEEIPP